MDPERERELKRVFKREDKAAARAIDPGALADSLTHFGGYCDCEVLANVEPESIF